MGEADLSVDVLRAAFDYDPLGGHLIWRRKRRHVSDNRQDNLRSANYSESAHNTALSEFAGTSAIGRKWQARICVNRKYVYLGLFDSREQAHAAYLEARAKLVPFQPIPRRAA
jgi:AP2 domain